MVDFRAVPGENGLLLSDWSSLARARRACSVSTGGRWHVRSEASFARAALPSLVAAARAHGDKAHASHIEQFSLSGNSDRFPPLVGIADAFL